MDQSREEVLNCVREAISDGALPSKEIPSIDLYIDQIINLLDQAITQNKRKEDDKPLTKTMINNYSKEGLLKPIKGKKYSKEHIIQMLMIYELKQVLTMGDIKKFLTRYNADDAFTTEEFIELYDQFLSMKECMRNCSEEVSMKLMNRLPEDMDDSYRIFLMILLFANLSKYMKHISEKLIDTYL